MLAVAKQSEEWTVARALKWMQGRFVDKGLDSPRLDAELLLAEVLGCDRLGVITRAEQPLVQNEKNHLHALVRRRQDGEPVAYILGRKGFRDFELEVGKGVLTPRPETEFVVDTVLDLAEADLLPEGKVVDFGTGSGAIAIALQRIFEDRQVVAVEKSNDAFAYAKRNMDRLAPNIDLIKSDWVDYQTEKLALAVSNPPYVSIQTQSPTIDTNIAHEPNEALYAGDDGLISICELESIIRKQLLPGGWWVCECGFDQRPSIEHLLSQSGSWDNLRWVQDYSQIDRVFVVQRAEG